MTWVDIGFRNVDQRDVLSISCGFLDVSTDSGLVRPEINFEASHKAAQPNRKQRN